MRIETLENMIMIYPSTEGNYIFWNEAWVEYIATPLNADIEAIIAECVEHTPEQKAEIEEQRRKEQEALEDATEEDYLAALEVLGVSE